METFNQDPKPGRLVLPLVLIGMIATTYTFVTNEQLGDVFNPYEITISSTVDLSIELIAGFNWISYNVDAEDASLGNLLSSVADEAIFIASQS